MSEPDRILVVGGSGGMGAAIAADHGARAVVWSRRTGVDASDPVALRAATAAFVAANGAPWALVHAVGDYAEHPLLTTPPDVLQHLLHSNLLTTFHVLQAVVPQLVRAGRGRVVLFAAAGVEQGRAMSRAPVYFALKAAVVQLARALAAEVASAGVTVNTISPGLILHAHSHQESQQRMLGKVPTGRLGGVEDVVGLVRWLLSPASGYVTGENFTVDGGLQL
jgi:NAD(P)-dependent dehydrogenase (short-subunit alcohol dehydrogenase family)